MPSLTHDTVLRELRALAKKTDVEHVANAFVTSLASPPAFWRAPLIALAAARAVPSHRVGKTIGGVCAECGLDPAPELEPTHERGQCLPGDLAAALSALNTAKSMKASRTPTKDDVRRLARILALVGELPRAAREGRLSLAIAKEKLVVGNKYDRRHVIETLGACGILETPEHPGFTTRWTTFAARQDRPSVRVEADPPIAFWTAGDGVSKTNVATWFGHLGVKVPKTSLPRADATPAPSASAKKRNAQNGGESSACGSVRHPTTGIASLRPACRRRRSVRTRSRATACGRSRAWKTFLGSRGRPASSDRSSRGVALPALRHERADRVGLFGQRQPPFGSIAEGVDR